MLDAKKVAGQRNNQMRVLNQQAYSKLIQEYGHPITDEPAIFVADYASYNEGHISGAWFNLSSFYDYDDFMSTIKEFMAKLDKVAPLDFNMPREEIMFQDWQCIPDHFIGESSLSEDTWEYLDALSEDEDFADLFEAFISINGSFTSVKDIQEKLLVNLNEYEPNSHMHLDEKFGYWLEESGFIEIPEHISFYFDYQAYGRESLYSYADFNGFVFSL